MVKAYADLSCLPDEDRITVIGEKVLAGPTGSADKPTIIGVVVDNAAKAARYVKLMKDQFPTVRVIDQQPMGVGETVLIRFGGPLR